MNSETGKAVTAAKQAKRFCKAEYAFKLLHNSFIIKGSIDIKQFQIVIIVVIEI